MLEEGNALPHANGLDWIYTTTASSTTAGLTVSASATDLPGNTTTMESNL